MSRYKADYGRYKDQFDSPAEALDDIVTREGVDPADLEPVHNTIRYQWNLKPEVRGPRHAVNSGP